MAVIRLSLKGLNMILKGEIKEPSTCIIKFYSEGCDMCLNLSGYYKDIAEAEEYDDLHFFAFNMDNSPGIDQRLDFEGVPSLALIKAYPQNQRKPKLRILTDPEKPHSETWFTTKDIRQFIDKEK